MSDIIQSNKIIPTLAMLAISIPSSLSAQQDRSVDGTESIIVSAEQQAEADVPMIDLSATKGPVIQGVILARSGDRLKIASDDGTSQIIAINDATLIKGSGGFLGFGRKKLATDSLLNGLPVTVETLQSGQELFASKVTLKNKDLKTANMIRNGTAQGFAEQTAATQALRGRMGDIDQYNIKGTTNVHFDIGRDRLSAQGKRDLCATASAAEGVKNSLLLIVGYTDSTGGDDLNQRLSERRASRVVNYIQQACGWKPYRMLTPTGMAKADPLANNHTAAGRAQNRRVAVNILVSKGLDGL